MHTARSVTAGSQGAVSFIRTGRRGRVANSASADRTPSRKQIVISGLHRTHRLFLLTPSRPAWTLGFEAILRHDAR